jgi:outer membrane protein assembly factor BamB
MSHSGSMAAFDIRSGERIWEQPAGGLNAPTIAGDFLFLTTVNAELVAIERNTGAVRWLTQLQQFRNERKRKNRVSWAGPILAGNRLVVASSEGDLRFYDPANGEQMGERNLGDSVYIAPVIADETVLVLTDEGRLIALR